MNIVDAGRRDLLRASGLGLAMGLGGVAPSLAANAATGALFNVRDYGATGDGKTLDTAAINRAIDAAAAAGGGTVLVPSGDYLCFSLHLKSRVHLVLAQGSAIIAADSPLPGQATGYRGGRYDDAESNGVFDPYQDYGHNHWHNSLMWGENLHDISITGPGLIWGRGLSHGREIMTLGIAFKAEQPGVANKAIALKNCRNVWLADFSILKGGHFGLLLTGVDNLTIDNLKIDTDRDGMDIDCCKNVRVSNCSVNSPWDDGICPKSSYALGYPRVTENLTITNCHVTGCWDLGTMLDGSFKRLTDPVAARLTGRIKCGTESNGGFKNITISNCVFDGCQGLALESVDGAQLEDVTVSNITMRDVSSCPLFIRLGARLRGPKDSTKVGALRRVSIDNLVAHNSTALFSSIISGIAAQPIEDLHLSNIFIDHQGGAGPDRATIKMVDKDDDYPEPRNFGPTPSHGFFLRHIRNLQMSHVEVRPAAPDARVAFHLEDVTRADFFAVTAPAPAFALHRVKDLRVLWSRATPDVTLVAADGRTL